MVTKVLWTSLAIMPAMLLAIYIFRPQLAKDLIMAIIMIATILLVFGFAFLSLRLIWS